MTGKLLLPNMYDKIQGPMIFLAGPITGAPKWHKEAVKLIWSINPEINIASPSYEFDKEHLSQKDYERILEGFIDYKTVIDWESAHLRMSAENGAIMFWFPNEKYHYQRPYAQTSRLELGEWMTKHQHGECKNLVVGIEENFSGKDYIKYRLSRDCPEVPVLKSLEETCRKSLELIN